jgi:hypothetical protein
MAAAATPLGRTLTNLVGVLSSAVSIGGKIADSMGAGVQLAALTESFEGLKSAIAANFDYVLSSEVVAKGGIVGVATGDPSQWEKAFAAVVDGATRTVNALQMLVENVRPPDQRSDTALLAGPRS